jgi:hypothetical protein
VVRLKWDRACLPPCLSSFRSFVSEISSRNSNRILIKFYYKGSLEISFFRLEFNKRSTYCSMRLLLKEHSWKILGYVRFEVFTAMTTKNGVFWDVTPCGSCKNRVSQELRASFIRVTRVGEVGTTLALTSNRLVLCLVHRFLSP